MMQTTLTEILDQIMLDTAKRQLERMEADGDTDREFQRILEEDRRRFELRLGTEETS